MDIPERRPRDFDVDLCLSSDELSNFSLYEKQDKAVKSQFQVDDGKAELLWAVLASYVPSDERSIQKSFVHHAEYSLAQTRKELKLNRSSAYHALALSLRDRLTERWKDTDIYFNLQGLKRVNYLSLEFLLGRSMTNALSNLNLQENFGRALADLGIAMEDLYTEEHDAGLGNGGLGRLAACFLDSMATMNYPGWGYGIRYTYGMFEQQIKDGYQVELPDYWLISGNSWEIERNDVVYPIRFYDKSFKHRSICHDFTDQDVLDLEDSANNIKHEDSCEIVLAVAYDTPIPGFNTYNTLNLRLWSSRPSHEFDLAHFNQGDYFKAIEAKQRSETICSVLYPNDNTYIGKELRLKQQYFFVSASLQDIICRFKLKDCPFSEFPDHFAIQINDTHPSLGIPELMRLLCDQEGLSWDEAWDITTRSFAYTNHTVMPEALEKWQISLMEVLLPRIMSLIYDINHRFLLLVTKFWPEDMVKLNKLSIIEEEPQRCVRMAHLAIVGSHKVNGVAAIHTGLIKTEVFPEFYQIWPDKFINVTNGVTPRRWLDQANPQLSSFISKALKSHAWKTDLNKLSNLREYADQPDFQREWSQIKHNNKMNLAKWVKDVLDVNISPDALFDVQVKRFHEYKRQLLNILGVIYRYQWIKRMTYEERANVVPRVFLFGGKAAPGYYMAKLIIKLINTAQDVVNNDPDIKDLLKVVFLPNYCVSLAELVIPASDISEHISTAGFEASGTSNMKFCMNGSLIIGTLDGANVEIREEIGKDNIFIFGCQASQVPKLRKQVYEMTFDVDPRWTKVMTMLKNGIIGTFPELPILMNSLVGGRDEYLLSVDFGPYLDTQEKVDLAYKDQSRWLKMTINCTAGMGKFSSDRSIKDYAEKIWNIEASQRPGPVSIEMDRLTASGLLPEGSSATPYTFNSPSDVSMERLSPLHYDVIQHFSPSC